MIGCSNLKRFAGDSLKPLPGYDKTKSFSTASPVRHFSNLKTYQVLTDFFSLLVFSNSLRVAIESI